MQSQYLYQALELAKSRRGFCAPNPAVGAVVVKNGKIIAQGAHEYCGAAHAEVAALQDSEGDPRGATLYISLEPCRHWGQTPPCTDAIIEAGIAEVIYGADDPNPQMAGQSAVILQQAGISTRRIALPAIEDFYRSYRYWWQNHRPWVTAKLAMSLDGKIAGAGGKPVKITGDRLKAYTHQCRRQSDAILTTARTVNNDDPQLNVRLEEINISKPIYIIDTHLSLKEDLKIYQTAKSLTVFHAEDASHDKRQLLLSQGIHCHALLSHEKGVDLIGMINAIGDDGVHDLWVEAGGVLLQSLLEEALVQEVYFYVGTKMLGSDALPGLTGHEDLLAIAKSYQWHMVGEDVYCHFNLYGEY